GASPSPSVSLRWPRRDTLPPPAVTDGLNRLFSNAITPVRLVRDLGLAVVHRVPPLKGLLMRDAMGIVGDLPRLVRGGPLYRPVSLSREVQLVGGNPTLQGMPFTPLFRAFYQTR